MHTNIFEHIAHSFTIFEDDTLFISQYARNIV
jgi:hypothetical protein